MPPNGPVLQRVIAALDRMRSGYKTRLSDDGRHMIFVHATNEPFTLSTSPHLTVGQAWATIAERMNIAEFLEHYEPDETFPG